MISSIAPISCASFRVFDDVVDLEHCESVENEAENQELDLVADQEIEQRVIPYVRHTAYPASRSSAIWFSNISSAI